MIFMSKFCPDIPNVDRLRPDLAAAARSVQATLKEGITLRAIQPGDEEAIIHVLNNEKVKPWAAEEARNLVKASLDPTATGGGWLAFANSAPAGIITTKDGFNGSVITHQDFGGRGIGKALVGTREAHQRAQGQHIAEAHILSDNEKSIGLHEALGYIHQSAKDKLLPDGTTLQVYTKPLLPFTGPAPVMKGAAPAAPRR